MLPTQSALVSASQIKERDLYRTHNKISESDILRIKENKKIQKINIYIINIYKINVKKYIYILSPSPSFLSSQNRIQHK